MRTIIFAAQAALLIILIVFFPARSITATPRIDQSKTINKVTQKNNDAPKNIVTAQTSQSSQRASNSTSKNTKARPTEDQSSSAVSQQKMAPEKSLTVSISDLNQVFTAATLQFKITGGTISYGDSARQPSTNKMDVIISLNIENNDQNTVMIYPEVMFSLLDNNATEYGPLLITNQEEALYGNLGPGRIESGQVRFEIPRKPGNYKFEIDPSMDVNAQVIQIPVSIN